MAHISIETSQNVSLDLLVASSGERVIAYLIDGFILFLYYLVASKFFNFDHAIESISDDNGEALQAFANLIIFTAPIYFYDLVFEYFNKGKTPGKMLLKLQVMKINGEPAGPTEYWIRWLMRPVDMYGQFIISFILGALFSSEVSTVFMVTGGAFVGLTAFIAVASSKKGQRIGDLLAGTTVTKMRNTVSLSDTILLKTKKNYKPTYTNALKLSDKDVRLIKETLEYYNKTKDAKYIKKLAKKAQDFLEITSKEKNPVKFLRTLMKDYNHLAVEEDGRN